MGKTFAGRTLSSRGRKIYRNVSSFLTFIFFMVMLLYAGFRSSRIITQLPATYRSKTAPRQLPIQFLRDIIPSKNAVPTEVANRFEFPALSICPADPLASVNIVSCQYSRTALSKPCDVAGQKSRRLNIGIFGRTASCMTVNEAPSAPIIVSSIDDTLEIVLNVTGVSNGGPNGVLVIAHSQMQGNNRPIATSENMFTASSGTYSEVNLEKIWTIPLNNQGEVEYNIRTGSVGINALTNTTEAPIKLDIRYPELSMVYEKVYLPLDTNNWMGEVGGVAALLFFLHRFLMLILLVFLTRMEKYSEAAFQKKARDEGFDRFN